MNRKSKSRDKKPKQNGKVLMPAISALIHRSQKSIQTHELAVPFIAFDFIVQVLMNF